MAPSLHSLLLLLFVTPTLSYSTINTTTLCQSSPFPNSCFTSLKLSISISIPLLSPLLSFLLKSLNSAISQSTSLLPLLSSPTLNIIPHQKGSLQDCLDLHHITISSLQKSAKILTDNNNAPSSKSLNDIKTHLSAALTNKNTCLEGLESASGSSKSMLVSSWMNAYRSVSNSLWIVSKSGSGTARRKGGRRLMGLFPAWVKRKDRRLLQSGDSEGYDPSSVSLFS